MPGPGIDAIMTVEGPTSEYERFFNTLDSPMVVVTASDGEEWAGCAVGFHSRSSVDPPQYALWLSRANRTYRVALRSDFLGVHLLRHGDRDLGEWFAGRTGDDDDKFAGVATGPGPGRRRAGVLRLRRQSPQRFFLGDTRIMMLPTTGSTPASSTKVSGTSTSRPEVIEAKSGSCSHSAVTVMPPVDLAG